MTILTPPRPPFRRPRPDESEALIEEARRRQRNRRIRLLITGVFLAVLVVGLYAVIRVVPNHRATAERTTHDVAAASRRAFGAPLLVLTGGGLGQNSRLVSVNRRTLTPIQPGVMVPGWAFGYEWSWSPTDGMLALLARPSDSANRLYIIDAGRLRVQSRLSPAGGAVCALDWAAPRTLLVLVAEPQCDTPVEDIALLSVDPATGRTLASRTFVGQPDAVAATGSILASQTSGGEVAVLFATSGSKEPLSLLLATAAGVRSIKLPGMYAPAESAHGSAAASVSLAIDPTGDHAIVADADGIVISIDLRTGTTSRYRLPLTPPTVGTRGEVQTIEPLLSGAGTFAVTGARNNLAGRLLQPFGLRLVDTATRQTRFINAKTTSVLLAGDTLLAYGGPDGLYDYSLNGTLRYHLLTGVTINGLCASGGYAYASRAPSVTTVIDTETGRVVRVSHEWPGAGLIAPCRPAGSD